MSVSDYRDILSTAKWVQKNLQLTRVNAETYEQTFGTRTPIEILQSKKISYMNACPDLTVAFIHLLKQKGYDPKIVVEQREGQRTTLPTLHFATEITVRGKTLTVDFADSRRIVFYEGKYDPQKSHTVKSYRVHRFSTQRMSPTTTLNQLIRVKGTSTLYKRFPHVTPQAAKAVFETMQKADSPRLFRTIMRRKPTMRRVR